MSRTGIVVIGWITYSKNKNITKNKISVNAEWQERNSNYPTAYMFTKITCKNWICPWEFCGTKKSSQMQTLSLKVWSDYWISNRSDVRVVHFSDWNAF